MSSPRYSNYAEDQLNSINNRSPNYTVKPNNNTMINIEYIGKVLLFASFWITLFILFIYIAWSGLKNTPSNVSSQFVPY